MKNFMKKKLALLLALAMAFSLSACASQGPSAESKAESSTTAEESTSEGGEASAIDTSKEVNVKMHILGDGPVDASPLQALSDKIKEKVNASFELVPLGWDSTATELLYASGEPFDLIYIGAASYPTTVRNGSLMELDEMLPVYAPQSLKNTSEAAWEQAKLDGKIYAIPNRFTEYIPGGIIYRGDLMKKYGIDEIKSTEDMAKYFDNVLTNEEGMSAFMPSTGWSGWYMSEMFINLTKSWIPLEIVTGMMFVAESVDKPESLSYPVFSDEFMEFAKLMKEWDTKGYWSKDILSNTAEPSNEFLAGKTAAYFQHAQGYIGTYGTIVEALPESDPKYYCFSEAAGKVLQQPAMANATALSRTSENPERALMVLDLLLNDQEINNLCQYGVKDKNYAVDAEGFFTRPEGYDEAKDAYSVGTWNLNVDEFTLPNKLDYPQKAELNKKLGDISHVNPFAGFAFDDTNVVNEVAAVNQINSQIGTEILYGKVDDAAKAVEDYRTQLTNAGIQKILDEVIKQYKEFSAK